MGGIAVGVENSASAWSSVFNLGNCAIGAGILSFPYAFRRSGLLGGVCLCMLVAVIEYITLNILMRQTTLHGAFTYQGLVKHGLGKVASEVMSWTILFFIFGSCVAYIIIVGDTFGAVWRDLVIVPFDLPPILGARALVILVPALTVMLPISLNRSMLSLAPASTAALGVMVFTTGIIVAKAIWFVYTAGVSQALAHVQLFVFSARCIPAIPIMVFAYHCHVQAVPIYYELTDDPKLFTFRSTPHRQHGASDGAVSATPAHTASAVVARKLRGAAAVLATAYAECTILYTTTGAAGYILFPASASSNILNNFPPDDALMQLMRFCVGFAVLLHYPINQHVARSALYDLLCRYAGVDTKEHVPYSHVAALTLMFFAASVTTACIVHNLGVVFQVIGGLAGSLLVFVLPGALVIAHCSSGGRAAVSTHATPRARTACDEVRASPHAYSASERRQSESSETEVLLPMPAKGGSSTVGFACAGAERRGASGGGAGVNGGAGSADGVAGHSGGTSMPESSPMHSPVDVEVVGWLLVVLGIVVFTITLWLTVEDMIGPQQGDTRGRQTAGGGTTPGLRRDDRCFGKPECWMD